MLQSDFLFEWRTIIDNVMIGPEIQRLDLKKTRTRGEELLRRYGLGEFMHHHPHQLSGGMRQRAALARTLVTEPDVLLLDEPFSALDYQTRLALADEVGVILRREGKTVILVTHNISEAITMTDRVIVMSRRPGRIRAEHAIAFPSQGAERPSPFNVRKAPEFTRSFDEKYGTNSTSTLAPEVASQAAAPIPEEGPSPLFLAYVRRLQFERRMVRVAQVTAIAAFFALWEIAPRSHWVNPLLTSYPSAVWHVFVEMFEKGTMFNHVWVTFEETIVGFVVGLSGGIAIAIALWWSQIAHRVVDPFLVVLNALPEPRWRRSSTSGSAPSCDLWDRDRSRILHHNYHGLQWLRRSRPKQGEVRPNLRRKPAQCSQGDTAGQRSDYGCGAQDQYRAGAGGRDRRRISASKAGLGYLIVYGSQIFQMNMAMMAITILAIISTAMYVGIFYFERAVLRHRQHQ